MNVLGEIVPLLIVAVVAYLVGSIPVGAIVSSLTRRIDIRQYGTGNIGASNVWRNAGPLAGTIVAILGIAQGLWPTYTAIALGYPTYLAGCAGVAAILGNAWPVYGRFGGGRGVAVSIGVLIGLVPILTLGLAVIFAIGLVVRRYALSMFIGLGLLPIYLLVFANMILVSFLTLVIYLILLVRRLEGIQEDFALCQGRDERLAILFNRLLHDSRPGQVLQGQRSQ